jgi:ribosomal protein S18 acetylase RimI-like enzyme
MRGYVESTWGKWEPAAQRRAHLASFSASTHWLLFEGKRVAGLVAAELHATHVQLVKLYLRAQFRDRGLGTVVLATLLNAARARAQPLRLRVLAVNTRAQAFYARHGFRESFRTTERVFMEARPNPSIERTSSSRLRLLAAAAHVKR